MCVFCSCQHTTQHRAVLSRPALTACSCLAHVSPVSRGNSLGLGVGGFMDREHEEQPFVTQFCILFPRDWGVWELNREYGYAHFAMPSACLIEQHTMSPMLSNLSLSDQCVSLYWLYYICESILYNVKLSIIKDIHYDSGISFHDCVWLRCSRCIVIFCYTNEVVNKYHYLKVG